MHWTDIPRNPSPKTLRQFAAAWLVFFLAFGAHQHVVRHHYLAGVVLGVMAVTLGVLGLIKPGSLRWLFVTWMVLAFPVGWLVSQIMLLLMFYLLITPVALLFRVQGRDPLARKPAPERTSFWAPKKMPNDVRSYFRQY